MGSPGVEELRWRKPVRPGDALMLRLRIVSKEPSPKFADRGIVDAEHELMNQKNELVMSFRIRIMIARRASG
jgi:acyl dehydratase